MKTELTVQAGVIRVLLVDDHQMFLDSLDRVLRDESDIEIVGHAADGPEAQQRILETHPDVVVLDYELPGLDGGAVARWIRDSDIDTYVVMITGNASLPAVRDSLESGCTGVVTKDRAASDLVAAIRSAAVGEATVAVPAMSMLLNEARLGTDDAGLTPRELEVLALLGQGASTEELATALFVSRNTVRSHVQRVLTKMGARSKLEAVVMARERGILS